ncbi:MAG: YoaK family protein [Xanthobacteraceae bacterium]
MTDAKPSREVPVPAAMPILLSFVAGYVDSYTYLALFGLFVAQVTSSFVLAGAELVTHNYGIAGKLLALVTFIVAAALTAALVGLAREKGRAALPLMLSLEALLLIVFVALILFGPAIKDASDWHGILAGLFAATAMGSQSVLVRLLMKGIPQTNVMTGNMTQLGIAVTDLILAWRRLRHSRHTRADLREFAAVRRQLLTVLFIALGFLVGAASGALAFAVTGLPGALLAVAIVGALALWALVRERRARNA